MIIIIVLLFAPIFDMVAQKSYIKIAASTKKEEIKKGQEFAITLKIIVKKDWYIFSLNEQINSEGIGPTPTEINADNNFYEILFDKFTLPKPKKKYDEAFEMDVEYYDGEVNFSILAKAKKDISFKNDKPIITVYFQLCTEGKCIPPEETRIVIANTLEKSVEKKTGKSFKKDYDDKFQLITPSNSVIQFLAYPSKSEVKAGEEFKIKLEMFLSDYWYTYSLKEQLNPEGIGPTPTDFFFDDKSHIQLIGDIIAPTPKVKYDKGFEIDIDTYESRLVFILSVKSKKDLNFLYDEEPMIAYLQLCDTVRCLPPEEYYVYLSSEVFDYSPASEEVQLTESQREIEEKKRQGIFSYLWFAMSMGAVALLTPCVFPMIPITVSFFTKRAEKNPGKGLRDSIIYAIGIISTFTALGFLLALILGSTGIQDFATNPWVNLFIAAIFIIFALNLFGAFEIQIPPSLLNMLNVKSQGGGIFSVLLMGLTFSLTSFTCTVPFVGTSLVAASAGEWFSPIIGMLGFSAVFAAPFFLLALFPSMLHKLPKSGGWMNNVKVVMGFLEIAAAVKFISNADLVWKWGILPKEVFLAIWIGCSILITLYILGLFRFAHDSPVSSVSTPRIIFAIFFTSITVYLWTGLYGKPLGELDAFLPPQDYEELMSEIRIDTPKIDPALIKKPNPGGSENEWFKDYQSALALAKTQNKFIFIDFTGFTCTNCRWMESKMFTKSKVSNLLDKYVKVKLFTDRPQEPYKSNKKMQMQRFNSIELPLYVILTPDEKLIATKAFTRDEQEFIEFLQKGLN